MCACFSSSPSQTEQDGRHVGVGEWRWCLRVVDVDVCWDGTDEPNQFSTGDYSNPTVPLREPARRPESPRRDRGRLGSTAEFGSNLLLPRPWRLAPHFPVGPSSLGHNGIESQSLLAAQSTWPTYPPNPRLSYGVFISSPASLYSSL